MITVRQKNYFEATEERIKYRGADNLAFVADDEELDGEWPGADLIGFSGPPDYYEGGCGQSSESASGSSNNLCVDVEEGVLIELAGTEEKKINGIYRENEEEEDSDSTPQIEGNGVGGDEKKDGSKDVESRLSLTDEIHGRGMAVDLLDNYDLDAYNEGRCMPCNDWNRLKDAQVREKMEMVATFAAVAILGVALAFLVRRSWIVGCLNANKDSVEVLGVPPQDPSSDYGVEWMAGVPYIEVANSEEIQARIRAAYSLHGSTSGCTASCSLLDAGLSNNTLLVLKTEVQYRVWCPDPFDSRRQCYRRQSYVVSMKRNHHQMAWKSGWDSPPRAFCRAYLGADHCNQYVCG